MKHDLVRVLGNNARHMDRQTAYDDQTILERPGIVYQRILGEIIQNRQRHY